MGGDFIFVNQCRLDLKPPPVYKANFVYAKSFPLRLKHDLKLYQVIFTATRTSRRKIHLLAVQIHDHAEYRAKTYCLRLQFIIMTAYTVGIAGMIFHHMFYICNTHFVQQMLYHGSHASQAQNTVRKRYSCRILPPEKQSQTMRRVPPYTVSAVHTSESCERVLSSADGMSACSRRRPKLRRSRK